jgi:hypothetical protein
MTKNIRITELIAAPVAVGLAFLLTKPETFFASLFHFWRIWLHEFGHAIAGWSTGHRAMPMGMLATTFFHPERSLFVFLFCIVLMGLLARIALKSGYSLLLGFWIFSIFFFLWAFLSKKGDQEEAYFVFSGVGGEMILGAFAIASFYARMPKKMGWPILRWPVLIFSAFTFASIVRLFWAAQTDHSLIPYGTSSVFADESGSHGDMNRLIRDFAYSPKTLVAAYVDLAKKCVAFLVIVFFAGSKLLELRDQDGLEH